VASVRARSRYRPRRIRLRDGREVTLREIEEGDASKIVAAFERLSAESRYSRFMQHKKQLDAGALERGVHPRPGLDYVLVATVPAPDGIDIVGAAQYVRAQTGDDTAGGPYRHPSSAGARNFRLPFRGNPDRSAWAAPACSNAFSVKPDLPTPRFAPCRCPTGCPVPPSTCGSPGKHSADSTP